MLTDNQQKMIEDIISNEKCSTRLTWIEVEWVKNFQLRFKYDNSPCVFSQKTLIKLWKKATCRG